MSRIHQGIDSVDVEKFRAVLARNPGLADGLFTEEEREYFLSRRDPSLHFAGRFAAKESYLKALGTGFQGTGIDHIFQEIEIRATNSGKPEIVIRAGLQRWQRDGRYVSALFLSPMRPGTPWPRCFSPVSEIRNRRRDALLTRRSYR